MLVTVETLRWKVIMSSWADSDVNVLLKLAHDLQLASPLPGWCIILCACALPKYSKRWNASVSYRDGRGLNKPEAAELLLCRLSTQTNRLVSSLSEFL